MRFDLVVNDLAGHAWTEKVIRMDSDGKPWRPFVHILDISRAIECVLSAPRDIIHDEIFNVGSNAQNYQIRDVAAQISEAFPGCRLEIGDSTGDNRNYKANFDKIHERLPGFETRYDVARGAQPAARGLPGRRHDDRAVRVPRPHPDQADQAPARDRARSTTTSTGSIRRAARSATTSRWAPPTGAVQATA